MLEERSSTVLLIFHLLFVFVCMEICCICLYLL